MANPNPTPSLPSTADQSPYVPVSWMAVSALAVSSLFMVLLIVLGLSALKDKKQLLIHPLLVLPVIGLILSFAARRVILNSEGTRSGQKLASTAWWICMVLGLGYATYILAIDFSVRGEAVHKAEEWVNFIVKDEASDPVHVNLNRAFIRTVDPEKRQMLPPDKPELFESAQFRDQYLAFKQLDIVRLIQRNPGECEFTAGGVKEWMDRANGVDCIFTGTLKCPEGDFPVEFPLKAFDGAPNSKTSGREWIVLTPGAGVFVHEKIARTPYGWMMDVLERSGNEFGKEFIFLIGSFQPGHSFSDPMVKKFASIFGNGLITYPIAYHSFIEPDSKLKFWESVTDTVQARCALGGGPAGIMPYFTQQSKQFYQDSFLKLPNGGQPDQDQKARFKKSWDLVGLVPPGARLRTNPDKASLLVIKDPAIEISLPCELPIPGTEIIAARYRLVLECTDRTALDEVKQLRNEAKGSPVTPTAPEKIRSRTIKWRVARLESDMREIKYEQPQRPGGAPPPGQ